jgi:hypothetical protein
MWRPLITFWPSSGAAKPWAVTPLNVCTCLTVRQGRNTETHQRRRSSLATGVFSWLPWNQELSFAQQIERLPCLYATFYSRSKCLQINCIFSRPDKDPNLGPQWLTHARRSGSMLCDASVTRGDTRNCWAAPVLVKFLSIPVPLLHHRLSILSWKWRLKVSSKHR